MSIKNLLFGKKSLSGSEAVEAAVSTIEKAIAEIGTAVEETNQERVDAAYAVKEAENQLTYLTEIQEKGKKFLDGLRNLIS